MSIFELQASKPGHVLRNTASDRIYLVLEVRYNGLTVLLLGERPPPPPPPHMRRPNLMMYLWTLNASSPEILDDYRRVA